MATTSVSKLPPSGYPVIDALTNGTYWALDGTRTVTWAIADAPGPDWKWSANGATIMQGAMAGVLSRYSEVANVRFQYVGWFDNLTTAPADIVLGATLFPQGFNMTPTTYARAYFPNEPMSDLETAASYGSPLVYPNASGDVILNFASFEMANANYLPGGNGFFAMLHEVGHAVGLKHPHDNGGTTGRPTFAQINFNGADNQALTVMSYDSATSLAAWLQRFGLPAGAGYPETLMPLDVVALQSIYGPNTTTRAGNNVYELFNDDAIETFWDAGGQDVLTAAGSFFGWNIVSVASLDDQNLVVAVPRDWTSMTGKFYFNVEHLEGSQYADVIVATVSPNTLVGLGGNDRLTGNGGNDNIDGGLGLDTATYGGTRASYGIQGAAASGLWSVADYRGFEGFDTLASVERLAFSDGYVALDMYPGAHAHSAALLLRAILGPQSLKLPALAGAVIGLLDSGISFDYLVSVGITTPYFEQAAGSTSNEAFVRTVYKNVVGFNPPPGDLAYFTGLLDNGTFTRAQLGVIAAQANENVNSVELIGLASTGLDYVLPAG